jgi:hypothetical protein
MKLYHVKCRQYAAQRFSHFFENAFVSRVRQRICILIVRFWSAAAGSMVCGACQYIPDSIWDVAFGGLTDGEPMFFAWGQPTRSNGRFHEISFGSLRNRWGSMTSPKPCSSGPEWPTR